MKISQVVVNVLKVPVDHPYVAAGRTVDANWHVLARITTSDGVEGVGYIVYPRPDLMTAICHAAHAHLVEYVPRSAGILTAMPRLEHGELVAPDGAGLGLELNEAAVQRYQVL